MDFNNLTELKKDDLILKKISESDRKYIESIIQDTDIRKCYIVSKEAQQDYKRLVSYWLNDISNGTGYVWIISQKSNNIFSTPKSCGFIAFEFRDSLKNTRISYALNPNFRKKES